jgi:hypothetical protein
MGATVRSDMAVVEAAREAFPVVVRPEVSPVAVLLEAFPVAVPQVVAAEAVVTGVAEVAENLG